MNSDILKDTVSKLESKGEFTLAEKIEKVLSVGPKRKKVDEVDYQPLKAFDELESWFSYQLDEELNGIDDSIMEIQRKGSKLLSFVANEFPRMKKAGVPAKDIKSLKKNVSSLKTNLRSRKNWEEIAFDGAAIVEILSDLSPFKG